MRVFTVCENMKKGKIIKNWMVIFLPLLELILSVADDFQVRMFSDPLPVHLGDAQLRHDMCDTACISHQVGAYGHQVQNQNHTANWWHKKYHTNIKLLLSSDAV